MNGVMMETYHMKHYIQTSLRSGMVCLLLTIASQSLFAQNNPTPTQDRVVSGTVFSAVENIVLPGVSVLIAGTTTGMITDAEGKFNIKSGLKAGDKLVFSYLSYISQSYVVTDADRQDITIRLADAVGVLDEIATIEVSKTTKTRRGILKAFKAQE